MRKKIVKIMLIAVCGIVLLSGCKKETNEETKTYAFNVEEKNKIVFEVQDGYDINSDAPFMISKDGEKQAEIMFINKEKYSEFCETVKIDKNATIIDADIKDDNNYMFWSYNNEDKEYDVAMLIKDSDIGVFLKNTISAESAKECFEALNIHNE